MMQNGNETLHLLPITVNPGKSVTPDTAWQLLLYRLGRLLLVPPALASCFALPGPSMDSYRLHGPGPPRSHHHPAGVRFIQAANLVSL